MKTFRFNESQIIAILKRAESGTPVPELCRDFLYLRGSDVMATPALRDWHMQSGEVVASTAKERFIMKAATVGLDLTKTLLQVYGVDSHGHTVVRKQLRRPDVLAFLLA